MISTALLFDKNFVFMSQSYRTREGPSRNVRSFVKIVREVSNAGCSVSADIKPATMGYSRVKNEFSRLQFRPVNPPANFRPANLSASFRPANLLASFRPVKPSGSVRPVKPSGQFPAGQTFWPVTGQQTLRLVSGRYDGHLNDVDP